MRFRSGTLGRSVKRWGRGWPPSPKLKRVQHGWKYVELEEEAMFENGSKNDIVLSDFGDWAGGSTDGANGRNISLDLIVGVTWTPVTSGDVFDSWMYKWGIFVIDTDDTASTTDATFGSHRAIKWGAAMRNTNSLNAASPSRDQSDRHLTFRIKCRIRHAKFDEEIRYVGGFSQDVSSTISDARLWIFGRVSWEQQ